MIFAGRRRPDCKSRQANALRISRGYATTYRSLTAPPEGGILLPPRLSARTTSRIPLFGKVPLIASESAPFPSASVSLTLTDLPPSVAAEVQQIQQEDPALLNRIVVYGVTRAAIFGALLEELSAPRV